MTDRDLLVLVVDDDPTIREALALRAEDWGYQTCTAADLAEAETLLAERDPDLVVEAMKGTTANREDAMEKLSTSGSGPWTAPRPSVASRLHPRGTPR